MVKQTNCKILEEVRVLMKQLTPSEYQQSRIEFKEKSIGSHVRHILEFYEMALNPSAGCINYDDRTRNALLENHLEIALQSIDTIQKKIRTLELNQSIQLSSCIQNQTIITESSIGRELIYCMEHCIHHMAFIEIVVRTQLPHIELPKNFGIAFSTQMYENQHS